MTLSLCGGTLNFDEVGYTNSEWGTQHIFATILVPVLTALYSLKYMVSY